MSVTLANAASWLRVPVSLPAEWLMPASYLAAALACLLPAVWPRSRRAVPGGTGDRSGRWWIGLCLLLLAIGLFRHMELGAWVSRISRQVAAHHGWYGLRKVPQVVGTLLVPAFCAGLLLWRRCLGRTSPRCRVVAESAVVCLAAVAAVEMVSLHGVDSALHIRVGHVPAVWLAEIGVLACVVVAATSRVRRRTVSRSLAAPRMPRSARSSTRRHMPLPAARAWPRHQVCGERRSAAAVVPGAG